MRDKTEAAKPQNFGGRVAAQEARLLAVVTKAGTISLDQAHELIKFAGLVGGGVMIQEYNELLVRALEKEEYKLEYKADALWVRW